MWEEIRTKGTINENVKLMPNRRKWIHNGKSRKKSEKSLGQFMADGTINEMKTGGDKRRF